MALFQKQDSCSSNKATTACRHSASSLRSPPGLHSREGRYTEIKMPFAPPAMCRLTIYIIQYTLLSSIHSLNIKSNYILFYLLTYKPHRIKTNNLP